MLLKYNRIAFLFIFFFTAVNAQTDTDYRYELVLGSDNDKLIAYTSTDRNYTYGIQTALRWRTKPDGFLQGFFPNKTGNYNAIGLHLEAYTPNYLDNPRRNGSDMERPFAGWGFVSFEATTTFKKSFLRTGVEAGILGPASQAETIQNWFHETISNDATVDWTGQIPNQFGINFTGVYAHGLFKAGWVDSYGGVEASIGTIFTYLMPQVNFRLGKFNGIGESVATQNALLSSGNTEFFLAYGLGYKLSAYNATVQGNLFKDDAGSLKDINHGVFTMHLGAHLNYKRLGVLFTYNYGTGEFEKTQVHRYGAIRLLYRFR